MLLTLIPVTTFAAEKPTNIRLVVGDTYYRNWPLIQFDLVEGVIDYRVKQTLALMDEEGNTKQMTVESSIGSYGMQVEPINVDKKEDYQGLITQYEIAVKQDDMSSISEEDWATVDWQLEFYQRFMPEKKVVKRFIRNVE